MKTVAGMAKSSILDEMSIIWCGMSEMVLIMHQVIEICSSPGKYHTRQNQIITISIATYENSSAGVRSKMM